jgi:hypothetical protein
MLVSVAFCEDQVDGVLSYYYLQSKNNRCTLKWNGWEERLIAFGINQISYKYIILRLNGECNHYMAP